MTKVVGYIRVSTKDQDVEKNEADILRFANEHQLGPVEFVREKVSGLKHWKKRKLGEVFDTLEIHDTIIVPELSRLGRSTLQILEFMTEAKEKGVSIYAVKGRWRLDDSMQSKILLHVFSMVSEIERDLISERTKEGLRSAKEKGRLIGRPKGPGKSKLDNHRDEIIALLRNGSTKSYVSKRYGSSITNLNNWIRKNDLKVDPIIPSETHENMPRIKSSAPTHITNKK
jgi:DNA invertase Pin-like site-specific DNA recombinase